VGKPVEACSARQELRGSACQFASDSLNHYIPEPHEDGYAMRPETERNIDEIQQAIALLRRHL
jgi:hypothetical protein